MKNPFVKTSMLIVGLMALCVGCKNPGSGAMTHAVFLQAVTVGEEIALETHPEAVPYVRAAVPVVCGVAASTNVSPAAIVSALQTAGVTNETAKIIINGSLAIFNIVVSELTTNQPEVKAYASDLCTGMQAGLPGGPAARHRAKPLPPHL